jgi:hypothetical protein
VSSDAEAVAMVHKAIARYGGRARWERLRLTLTLETMGGLLPWLKGEGRTFTVPRRVEIEPSRARVIFADYPEPGATSLFERGRVALAGAPLGEHRESFRGWRKWRRWSPRDTVYFFGYALAHYHAVPFTLLEAELRHWDARRRALTVAFAPAVHTHCAVQTFYFDAEGLIVRHDYVAEIVGAWARGAHLWRDYVTVAGLPVARHRRVYARLLRLAVPVVAIDAHFAMPSISLG